jgi:resuscitation-promoting factor RpfA
MAMSNDGIERDPRLARLYEAVGDEAPPAALDAAILAAARREVNAAPQVVASSGGDGRGRDAVAAVRSQRNWYVPMSIAAVLVLSVSLVTLVQQEKGDELAQPPAPGVSLLAKRKLAEQATPETGVPEAKQAPAEDATATTRKQSYAAEVTATAQSKPLSVAKLPEYGDTAKPKTPAVPMAPDVLEKDQTTIGTLSGQPRSTPIIGSPRPAPRYEAVPSTESESSQRGGVSSGTRRLDSESVNAKGDAKPFRYDESRERRSRPTPFPAVRQAAPVGLASRDQSVAEDRSSWQKPSVSVPQRVEAASAASRIEDRIAPSAEEAANRSMTPEAESSASMADGRKQAKPSRAAKQRAKKRVADNPPERLAWLVELDTQPPQRWLDKLAEFKREDRGAEADELLAEFRARFPDHPASAR